MKECEFGGRVGHTTRISKARDQKGAPIFAQWVRNWGHFNLE